MRARAIRSVLSQPQAFRKSILAASIAALAATPTLAQDSSTGQEALALEEVVVTARKREESLQRAPIAITAISSADIEQRSIEDISEMGRFAPNVNFYTSTGATSADRAYLYIRGVGQDGPFITNDPGAGIYIDGIYLGRTQGAIARTLDVERVEILRGPQGTLFGRNTIAGAMNVITKKPDENFGGYMQLEAGEHGLLNAQGKINVPLADNLYSAFTVGSFHRDGYLDNEITGQEQRDDETLVGGVTLRWLPSDDLEINWRADATRRRAAGGGLKNTFWDSTTTPPGVPFNILATYEPAVIAQYGAPVNAILDSGDFYDVFGTVHSKDHQDIWGTSLTIDWRLSDTLSFRSITGYRDMEQDLQSDNDGTPAEVSSTLNTNIEQDQFSQELQLLGTHEKLNWVVGLFYFDESAYNSVVTTVFPSSILGMAGLGFSRDVEDYEVQNYAVFGQASYQFSEQWSATLGLRYNEEEKEIAFASYIPGTNNFYVIPPPPPVPTPGPMLPPPRERYTGMVNRLDETWDDVTGKISLEYQATEDHLYYASISDGFKSGTFNILQPVSNPTVDQETVIAYELGWKADWLNRRLRTNTALFFSDYEDQQILTSDLGSQSPFYDNVGDSEIWGVEFETTALLHDNWTADGSVGYTETEIADVGDNPALAVFSAKGNELPLVPNWNVSAGLTYHEKYSFGGLALRADYTYVSEMYADAANTPLFVTEGYGLWNLRASLRLMDEKLELYAYVKNLFDKEYATATFQATGLLMRVNAIGDPRQSAVGVKYSF